MTPLLGSWPVLVAVAAALLAGVAGLTASRSAEPARHVRGRLRLALGVFGVVLVAAWSWSTAQPELLGLPLVVGPGAAAAAAVLAFALPPAPAGASGTRRSATLQARTPAHVLRGRALVLPASVLVLLVAVLVTTGVTGDRTGDAIGRGFSIARAGVSAGGGPYPGWFYGIPILLTVLVLVLAVAIAVRRTVLLPALTTDAVADRAWRTAVGGTLVAIATAGLLLYLAGVLWAAGIAWRILEQTGTTGLGSIAAAQEVAYRVSATAALVLLVVAAVRVTAIGRAVSRKPVAA